jgi:thiamine-phosphate pyrophosphorylase
MEAFEDAGATLILNDRADLAVLAGWDGVHVGQRDLGIAEARRVLGKGVVGVSTHNEEQVRALEAEASSSGVSVPAAVDRRPDYVAIGPVFGTVSKVNPEPVVGLDGVREARALTTRPLVAIGGITSENAQSVLEAGADAVAVIGGLFVGGKTVREVARDFLRILG